MDEHEDLIPAQVGIALPFAAQIALAVESLSEDGAEEMTTTDTGLLADAAVLAEGNRPPSCEQVHRFPGYCMKTDPS